MTAQTSFEKPLVIIPAAGFGRRVGSPNSKEVLSISGKPLIDLAFSECEKRNWPIHLLTRPEKTELIDYCTQRVTAKIQIQLVGETKDWPQTVLLSEPAWQEWNLLFLPDLEFQPLQVLDQIFQLMPSPEVHLVAAGRATAQPQVWGCLRTGSDGFEICEKPQNTSSEWAWGFLAFRKSLGRKLFQGLLESGEDHSWKAMSEPCALIELDYLVDLTR